VKDIRIGRLAGMEVSMAPTAQVCSVALFAVVFIATFVVLHFSLQSAVVGSALVVVLHFGSEVLHNYGHFRAARGGGHPMTGVTLVWLLGRSDYPADEGELPPAVHVKRALGGPKFSAMVSVVLAVLAFISYQLYVPLHWVVIVIAADNLLVFTLGAFIPLGFTDGSTLLRYAGKS
jgi:hypothetical protein